MTNVRPHPTLYYMNGYNTKNPMMNKIQIALLVACLGLARSTVLMAQQQVPTSAAITEQSFLYSNTIALVKLDVSNIQLPVAVKVGEDSSLGSVSQELEKQLQLFRSIAENDSAYVAIDVPFSKAMPVARFFIKDRDAAGMKQLQDQLNLIQMKSMSKQNGFLCFSPTHAMQEAEPLAIRDVGLPNPGFAEAFQSVSTYPIQIAIVPPEYARRTVQELMPTLPLMLGGVASEVWTKGFLWGAIGINPENGTSEVFLQSESAESAKAIDLQWPTLMASMLKLLPQGQQAIASPIVKLLAANTKTTYRGSKVEYKLDLNQQSVQSRQLVATVLEQFTEQSSKQSKMVRFKKIGLACHNFESANRTLPPGKKGSNANGEPLLSWRVHILPYVDQLELYNQFRLDEPWNSPHNQPLLNRMPSIYDSAWAGLLRDSSVQPGYTTFLAPVGDDTIFGQSKPVAWGDIKDGSSNTVWLVEVKPEYAVPWTAPHDYFFDPKNPAAGLRIGSDGSALMGRADGSVSWLPANIDAKKMLNLFQKSDGNVID